MATITLGFTNINFNSSLQVGDTVYYSNIDPNGANTDLNQLGVVQKIDNEAKKIIVNSPQITTQGQVQALQPPIYISFSKNNIVNLSSLKGYYAEVSFVNNSKEKAELFSVGAEIQQSSK